MIRQKSRMEISMDEKLEALQLYRMMKKALNTPGIDRLEVVLGKDGEFEVYVDTEEEDKCNTQK